MKHSKKFYAAKEDQELSKPELLPGTGSQLIYILQHKTHPLGQNLPFNYWQTHPAPLLHLLKLLSQGVMWEDWF